MNCEFIAIQTKELYSFQGSTQTEAGSLRGFIWAASVYIVAECTTSPVGFGLNRVGWRE